MTDFFVTYLLIGIPCAALAIAAVMVGADSDRRNQPPRFRKTVSSVGTGEVSVHGSKQ